MTFDDVLLTARLVVEGRVHCVTDESVKAMAQALLDAHWKPVAHEDSPTLVEEPQPKVWRFSTSRGVGEVSTAAAPRFAWWVWRENIAESGIAQDYPTAQAEVERRLAEKPRSEWRHNAADPGMYLMRDGVLVATVSKEPWGWCWVDCLSGLVGACFSPDEAKAAAEASLAQSHTTERD